MKVLLLSVTAGQGHHSASKALMDEFLKMNIECKMLDTYKYLSTIIGATIDKGYDFASSVVPALYGNGYRSAEKKNQENEFTSFHLISAAYAHKISAYIEEEAPDFIICTHIGTALLMNYLKEHKELKIAVMGIITDFTVQPYWDNALQIEYIVCAHELLRNQFIKRNVVGPQILPLGIPINTKFSNSTDKTKAREMLGISPDKFTILLMSGGAAYGNLPKLLKSIDELDFDFQLLCVCGKNKPKYLRISKLIPKLKKTYYLYGFVDNVDIMMDASDCLISKPGGLSSSEALAKKLPLIIVNPIPGQEERNAEFFLNNGAAMLSSKTFPVDECIYELFTSETRIDLMKKSMEYIAKPNSARDICTFVYNKMLENKA